MQFKYCGQVRCNCIESKQTSGDRNLFQMSADIISGIVSHELGIENVLIAVYVHQCTEGAPKQFPSKTNQIYAVIEVEVPLQFIICLQ